MTKVFVKPEDVGATEIKLTSPTDIKHLTKVLRMREGDRVDVSDSARWDYACEISSVGEKEILLRILDKQAFAKEPEISICLFQGVPKAGKMDLVVQKAVELGACEITPVFMDRSVVVDKGGYGKKIERYQKIADEAAKQCRRGLVPTVGDALKFDAMVDRLADFDLVVFPYEDEEKKTIKDCLRDFGRKPKTVAAVVGPEGGFSDREVALLSEHTIHGVSLGKTILRTETAALATLAMLIYEFEL